MADIIAQVTIEADAEVLGPDGKPKAPQGPTGPTAPEE